MPKEVFATAFFALSSRLLSKMAKILGKDAHFQEYSDLSQKICAKYVETFIIDDCIGSETQADYAVALGFDLLPEELRPSALTNLIKAIEKYDYRISTGFISTIQMMSTIIQIGSK